MLFVGSQCAIPFDSVISHLDIYYLSDVRAYSLPPKRTHNNIYSNMHKNLGIFHMLINRERDRDIVIHSHQMTIKKHKNKKISH